MQSILEISLTFGVLIFSIIVHEIAHGYAANALGDPTAKLSGRLTLNPFPHIDLVGSLIVPLVLMVTNAGVLFGWAKPVPYNPYNLKNQRWGEAIVAVSGSATNLFLALIFAGVVHAATAGFIPPAAGAFASTIVFVNLFLGLFNLIPVPPMDGYTVLRGLLPYRLAYGFQQFEQRIRGAGVMGMLVVLFLFSFILAAPFFAFVSWIFTHLVGG